MPCGIILLKLITFKLLIKTRLTGSPICLRLNFTQLNSYTEQFKLSFTLLIVALCVCIYIIMYVCIYLFIYMFINI